VNIKQKSALILRFVGNLSQNNLEKLIFVCYNYADIEKKVINVDKEVL